MVDLNFSQYNLKINKSIWLSLQRRKSNETGFSLSNAVEYLIMDFAIEDLKADTKTVITKEMFEKKMKEFKELEKKKLEGK